MAAAGMFELLCRYFKLSAAANCYSATYASLGSVASASLSLSDGMTDLSRSEFLPAIHTAAGPTFA